ncbi:MAG: DUF58 domain-containing protein [Deltaproteobacteria bacterium]|nr:DUF58 domain-containing protein [Deltaproteobacteria bacterium]
MLPRELLKKIRRIEILTRRRVDETFAGQYHSVFKGRGMEFAEVREYAVGDDVRAIDWNVTARMGRPFLKLFEEERELTVMIVADISASMDTGSGAETKRETAATLAAILAMSAVRNQDKVGALLFGGDAHAYVPPGKGQRHAIRIVRDILYEQPKKTGTDIEAAMALLGRLQKKRAVVFVITDLLGMSEPGRAFQIAARRHDLVVLHVEDPRERTLAGSGLIPLTDPETGAQTWIDLRDPATRARWTETAAARETARKKALLRIGVDRVKIDAGSDVSKPLLRFFRERALRLGA